MKDLIERQAAIEALIQELYDKPEEYWDNGLNRYDIEATINALPSAQPEYKPVTAEDFAKTMSENTLYGFMTWHGEALALMKEQGFVICKKTM